MKKFLFAFALLLAYANNTFAQWYVYRTASEIPTVLRGYASFNYGSIKETVNGQTLSFNPLGATIGGMLCPNLTFNTLNRKPLFLEVGAEFSYMYGHTSEGIRVQDAKGNWTNLSPIGDKSVSLVNADGNERPAETFTRPTEAEGGGDATLNMFYASVPVNLTYYIEFPKANIAVAPFLGVNLRFNIKSQIKADGQTYNRLKEESVNIFQFGINAGVNVMLVRGFTVGYRFQPDIMHYAENVSTMTHSLMLGYRF